MRFFLLTVFAYSMVSCVTYYQMNLAFNQAFESGNMVGAVATLDGNAKVAKGKERLLYYLNHGVVSTLLDKSEESNFYFEKAYIYGEDYQINYANEVGAFLVNPMIVDYKGEDHEHLMLLYYKALNYLKLGDNENALVECRRLNIRLQQLNDKYKNETKYQRDAFIHTLIGLIYDADHDYNNAFIAYRNAYEIYQAEYQNLFNLDAPNQLKKDILRTAYLLGFHTELNRYQKEFGMKHIPSTQHGGDLIFFWNNGLGPVKYEYSINFSLIHGEAGNISFKSEMEGFSFPFWMNDTNGEETNLTDLEFYRMTIPQYRERVPRYTQAQLMVGGRAYPLEKGEDINQIAHYSLQKRMKLELGKSLLRMAAKKVAEYQLREEDESLGTALGILNALTEKADTRNWQTIPHTIHYTRVALPKGDNEVKLRLANNDIQQEQTFNFNIAKNKTTFFSYFSLESMPPYQQGY